MKLHRDDSDINPIRDTSYSKDHHPTSASPTPRRYETSGNYLRTGTSANGYPNSTFGSTARLTLPKVTKRQDFILPRGKMDSRLGFFPKAPRAMNLNYSGRDSPNPSKYVLK